MRSATFPNYIDGKLDKEPVIKCVYDEDGYTSVEDCLTKLRYEFELTSVEKCKALMDMIDNALEKNVVMKFLMEEKRRFISELKMIFDEMPNDYVRNKYISQRDELTQAITKKVNRCACFIRDNKEAIFKELDTLKQEKLEDLKKRQSINSARYYQKKKELLGIPSKTRMTAEEAKEARKIANKKYAEKRKLMLKAELEANKSEF